MAALFKKKWESRRTVCFSGFVRDGCGDAREHWLDRFGQFTSEAAPPGPGRQTAAFFLHRFSGPGWRRPRSSRELQQNSALVPYDMTNRSVRGRCLLAVPQSPIQSSALAPPPQPKKSLVGQVLARLGHGGLKNTTTLIRSGAEDDELAEQEPHACWGH
jgi:hypothetical protein